MKRSFTALLLLTFFLLLFVLAPIYGNALIIDAKQGSSSADVQVDQVFHTVKIYDYGLVVINDTLNISPKGAGTVLLQNFSIGFPSKYGDNLDYCFAYNASNPDELLEVKLDTGLGGLIGFYGINVTFPEQGVNISSGESYTLTVFFVFSNLVSSENETTYNLDFPMYPGLAQNASSCNVTVILPPNAYYTSSTYNFSTTTLDTRPILKHTSSLTSFQSANATLTFSMHTTFPLINVNETNREIKLDQWGGLHLSDFYHITNKGPSMSDIKVSLPKGAYDVSARDEAGSIETYLNEGDAKTYPNATIIFRTTLEKNNATKFTVTYRLPWKKYVNQNNWHEYDLTLTLFENFDWTIKKLTVTVILPDGAEFQSSNPPPFSVKKSVLQETITFTSSKVTPFQNLDFKLTYGYLVFWASFYPTLWMGILFIFACVVAFFWRAPKPSPVPTVPVPPEDLRRFVEAYEGKTRILLDIESMENQLRKGRIPRRRYKVRKKMLDGRISTLSRDLTNLGEKIRAGGGKYANIMRQIEVAETMLEGVEKDIRRVEARYRRGEISKGAYHKLLQEYHRREERAKTTIDEVLLRLREEIR